MPGELHLHADTPASAFGLIEDTSDALAGIARFGGGALADDPPRRRQAPQLVSVSCA